MSAIFATISVASTSSLASMIHLTIFLAVPTLPSRHNFWAFARSNIPVVSIAVSPARDSVTISAKLWFVLCGLGLPSISIVIHCSSQTLTAPASTFMC